MTLTPEQILELVGYFASLLVLVSLLMTSVVKLRIINSIGSAIYVVYALCIRSYPTAVMNAGLVAINLYFLWRLSRKTVHFHLVRGSAGEAGILHFLNFYREDIRTFFPGFEAEDHRALDAYTVYADSDPVGLLLFRTLEDGSLEVALDYTTPRYRDCSVGKFLYDLLAKEGVPRLIARGDVKRHSDYLKKMGFLEQGDTYVRTLR